MEDWIKWPEILKQEDRRNMKNWLTHIEALQNFLINKIILRKFGLVYFHSPIDSKWNDLCISYLKVFRLKKLSKNSLKS